jgi:hypothetical protein
MRGRDMSASHMGGRGMSSGARGMATAISTAVTATMPFTGIHRRRYCYKTCHYKRSER